MRIGIVGLAANPPHPGHWSMVNALRQCNLLDRIVVKPSGKRPDKKGLISSQDRATMTHLLFPYEWFFHGVSVSIDFSDVYAKDAEKTIITLERLQNQNPEDDIYWCVGADLVVPQERFKGLSEIQAAWHRGSELWENWKFIVFPRGGYTHPNELDLPLKFTVLDSEITWLSSSQIVSFIQAGKPWEHLYGHSNHPVVLYIKRHGLYGWKGN